MVRIEDTDRERYVEGGVEDIIRSLKWAGIHIDEGVDLNDDGKVTQNGEHGPYIQSKRLKIYREHVEQLVAHDHAYFCFCTKERLEKLRKEQEAAKLPTLYDGLCRDISVEDAQERVRAGDAHVIRMKVPREGTTKFHDSIRGDVEFQNSLIDDQVLLKSDGFPTYHLANVVDDHLMAVTHVIRGEEWLSSTPKHILLYWMFGWEPPEFAHIPLLVNEKKQKLSKRLGDVSVEDFKEKGYLPEALVNFVGFLGWNPGDEREIFSMDELIKEFTLEKVGKSPAIFNLEKLDWYNREYMRRISLDELTERCVPFFVNAGLLKKQETRNKKQIEWLQQIVALEKDRAATLVELVGEVGFVFADKLEYEPQLLVWKKSTLEDAREKLHEVWRFLQTIDENEWTKDGLEQKVKAWISEKKFDTGSALWPMRVALSGKKDSPGPFEIAEVLGRENTVDRLQRAYSRL